MTLLSIAITLITRHRRHFTRPYHVHTLLLLLTPSPPGNNCKTPLGTIIQEGETVTENGMTCTCTMDNLFEDWDWDFGSKDGPYAQCSPATTTPPPTTTSAPTTTPQIYAQPPATPCLLSNGSLVAGLQPGSSVEVGCIFYTCTLDGMVDMLYNDCGLAVIRCADSVQGECCRTCPNGKDSKHRVRPLTHSVPYRRERRKTQDILLNKQYMFISRGELDSRKT